jgi:hypothetical protein
MFRSTKLKLIVSHFSSLSVCKLHITRLFRTKKNSTTLFKYIYNLGLLIRYETNFQVGTIPKFSKLSYKNLVSLSYRAVKMDLDRSTNPKVT